MRSEKIFSTDVRELVAGADLGDGELVKKLLGDLAYRSGALGRELAESGILLATKKADRSAPIRQKSKVCSAALKCVFGMDGTLAKTHTGLATRISRGRWRPTPRAVTSNGRLVVLEGASGTCGA